MNTTNTASIDLAQLDKLPLPDQLAALAQDAENKRQAEENPNLERIHLGMRDGFHIAEQRARRSLTSGSPAEPVARLQAEVSDRPFSKGEKYYGVVILNRERCSDDMLLYAAPVHDAAAPSTPDNHQKPIGWIKSSELIFCRPRGVSVNLWLNPHDHLDMALYAAPVHGAAAKTDHALPARRKPHSSEARDQAHAAGWNACLDAIEASATAAGAGSDQALADRVVEWSASRAPSVTVQDERVLSFDAWWMAEIDANDGESIGADYRHWAKKGYYAAHPVQDGEKDAKGGAA